MKKSFTLLHGTNLAGPKANSNYKVLLQKLIEVTSTNKFSEPTEIASQHENSFFASWEYEILKPTSSLENKFFLVVIAPDCPGCSPINPFHKIDNHPMFAVNVCKDYFVVWQEGDSNSSIKSEFKECKNAQDICSALDNFLIQIAQPCVPGDAPPTASPP